LKVTQSNLSVIAKHAIAITTLLFSISVAAGKSDISMYGTHPRGKLVFTTDMPEGFGNKGTATLELRAKQENSKEFNCILKVLAKPVEFKIENGKIQAEWEFRRHPREILELQTQWKVVLTDKQRNKKEYSGDKKVKGWNFGPHTDPLLVIVSSIPEKPDSVYRFEFGIGDSTIDLKAFTGDPRKIRWKIEPENLQDFIDAGQSNSIVFSEDRLKAILFVRGNPDEQQLQSVSLHVNDDCGVEHILNFNPSTSILLPAYAPPQEDAKPDSGASVSTSTISDSDSSGTNLFYIFIDSIYTKIFAALAVVALVVYWMARIHLYSKTARKIASFRQRRRHSTEEEVIDSGTMDRLKRIERLLNDLKRKSEPKLGSLELQERDNELFLNLQRAITGNFRIELDRLEPAIELIVVRNLSYLLLSILKLEEDLNSALKNDNLSLVNIAAKAIDESRKDLLNRGQFLLDLRNAYGKENVMLAGVTAGSYLESQRITSVVDELEFENSESEGNWLIIRQSSLEYLLFPIDFCLFTNKDSRRAVGMMFDGVIDINENSQYVQVYCAARMTVVSKSQKGERTRYKCMDKGRVGSENSARDTSSPRVRTVATQLRESLRASNPDEIRERLAQLFKELDLKLPSMVRRVTREMDELVKVSDLAGQVENRVKSEFESWKPELEKRFESIQQEVRQNQELLMKELKRQSDLLDQCLIKENETASETRLPISLVDIKEKEVERVVPEIKPSEPEHTVEEKAITEGKAEFEKGLPVNWRISVIGDLKTWFNDHRKQLPESENKKHTLLVREICEYLSTIIPANFTASIEYLRNSNPLELISVDIQQDRVMQSDGGGEIDRHSLLNLVVTLRKENSNFVVIMVPPGEYPETLRFISLSRQSVGKISSGMITLKDNDCFAIAKSR
jgi:hypothetical protein